MTKEEKVDPLRLEKKFKKEVKARLKSKGLQNIKYFLEYVRDHDNPNIILLTYEISQEKATQIINTVITEHELDMVASKNAKGY